MSATKILPQYLLDASVIALSANDPAHAIAPGCPTDYFSSDAGSPTLLAPGVANVHGMLECLAESDMAMGCVSASGVLTIGVLPGTLFQGMECYQVTLDIHDAPEPAGIGMAARRPRSNKKQGD